MLNNDLNSVFVHTELTFRCGFLTISIPAGWSCSELFVTGKRSGKLVSISITEDEGTVKLEVVTICRVHVDVLLEWMNWLPVEGVMSLAAVVCNRGRFELFFLVDMRFLRLDFKLLQWLDLLLYLDTRMLERYLWGPLNRGGWWLNLSDFVAKRHGNTVTSPKKKQYPIIKIKKDWNSRREKR